MVWRWASRVCGALLFFTLKWMLGLPEWVLLYEGGRRWGWSPYTGCALMVAIIMAWAYQPRGRKLL